MRALFIIQGVVLLCLFNSCKNESTYKLEEGTPPYQLAMDLMQKVPALSPDTSVTLISTDKFKFTNAEFIINISDKFGNKAEQLKRMNPQRLKEIIPEMAHDMAIDKLLLITVDEHNIEAPSEKVDSLLSMQFMRAGGKENFLKKIEQEGLKLSVLEENYKNYLMVHEYLNRYVFNDISISEEKIQELYNADKTASVRHILLLTKGKSEKEKVEIRKKMEDILRRAKNGESFTKLVQQYSEDPGSKDKGGLYENFPRGHMVKSFEDAAFSVPVGQISDIVETNYGYHILKIIDRTKETRPLEEIRGQIEQTLKKEQEKILYNKHIEALKQKHNFTVFRI
jgi:foldase protein PrsA